MKLKKRVSIISNVSYFSIILLALTLSLTLALPQTYLLSTEINEIIEKDILVLLLLLLK